MRRAFPYIGMLAVFIGAGAWIALYGWEMFMQDPKYVRIEDDVYIGGFLEAPPSRATAILNVCEQIDPYKSDFDTAHYLQASVSDASPDPGIPWLKKCVDWMIEQHNAGGVTYVHCFNGGNRSTTVVAAYLMHKHKDLDTKEALKQVQEKWPQMPTRAYSDLLNRWHNVLHGLPEVPPDPNKPEIKTSKEAPKEPAKETPKEPAKETPKESAKEAPKEPTKGSPTPPSSVHPMETSPKSKEGEEIPMPRKAKD